MSSCDDLKLSLTVSVYKHCGFFLYLKQAIELNAALLQTF